MPKFLLYLAFMAVHLWLARPLTLAQAGSRLDSLRQVLRTQPDSLRIQTYLALGETFHKLAAGDSVKHYARRGLALAAARQDTVALIDLHFQLYRQASQDEDQRLVDSIMPIYRGLQAQWGYSLDDDYTAFNNGYRYTHIQYSLQILPDSQGQLTWDSLQQPAVQARFIPNGTGQSGASKTASYWVKLRLHGRSDVSQRDLFMVGVEEASWDTVEVYHPLPGGGWRMERTGRRLQLADKTTIQDWRNLFYAFVPADSSRTFYLRLKGYSSGRGIWAVFLYHLPPDHLTHTEAQAKIIRGIFLGILLTQGFYFLLLFLVTRERSYLPYLIYILGVTIFAATSYGYQNWFPLQADYAWFIYFASAGLAGVGLLFFASSYLNIRRLLPRWYRVTQVFSVIFILPPAVFITILFLSAVLEERFTQLPYIDQIANFTVAAFFNLISLGLILIVTLGILALRQGYRLAAPFLVGIFFLIVLVGTTPVVVVLKPLFLIESITFARAITAAQLGIVLQLIFFALGVGQKIKLLQAENAAVLEAQLQAEQSANEKLRQADRLKDEFLANTSHELRTPLNGIIGIAEAVSDGVTGPTTPEMRDNLGMVIHSARRLSSLVNDILDFAKLKNAELSLQTRPLDLAPLVRLILKVNEALLQGRDLRLEARIPADLPPVLADENRLQQILYNLVGNALKFTGEGLILVSAQVQAGMVQVDVTDSGIGIAPDQQARIFQAFEQGDGSVSRRYGGTGLGLSITRQLVELHGGRIWVESQPGEGATFSFTLPLAAENEAPPDSGTETHAPPPPLTAPTAFGPLTHLQDEPALPVPALLSPPPPDSLRGVHHILVVDDEPVNRQVLKNHLAAEQYIVTSVMNGEQALAALEADQPFDLILLDVMMPRMSGFEVCQKIREKYLPSDLPVIMITAKNQVSDLVTGLSFGANDYIVKPFSKSELLARIKTHLNLGQINRATGRFVPNEFIRTLGKTDITEVALGDYIDREVTVFFSDIRRYTSLAEQMSPAENFAFVNAYVQRMGPVIQRHQGFVNQYLGDGIMAIFQRSPADAVQAAMEMQEVLHAYNHERQQQQRTPLRVGMGLHTGPLVMGIIGDSQRTEPAVISDTVNISSRIEGLTKYYDAGILLSELSYATLSPAQQTHCRYIGLVQVKGRSQPMGLYECFGGDTPDLLALKEANQAAFAGALQAFVAGDMGQAVAAFTPLASAGDPVAARLLTQSRYYLAQGLPERWAGVEVMADK